MNKTMTFTTLRQMLETLGYRHERVDKGEIFHQSPERELYYRHYDEREAISARDLAKTRSFLDDWGQLAAVDFDAMFTTNGKPE